MLVDAVDATLIRRASRKAHRGQRFATKCAGIGRASSWAVGQVAKKGDGGQWVLCRFTLHLKASDRATHRHGLFTPHTKHITGPQFFCDGCSGGRPMFFNTPVGANSGYTTHPLPWRKVDGRPFRLEHKANAVTLGLRRQQLLPLPAHKAKGILRPMNGGERLADLLHGMGIVQMADCDPDLFFECG
jgi:hypothetical protein